MVATRLLSAFEGFLGLIKEALSGLLSSVLTAAYSSNAKCTCNLNRITAVPQPQCFGTHTDSRGEKRCLLWNGLG